MAEMDRRSGDLQGAFAGRISRRLSLLLGLIFVVVLIIGGISLLSARFIYVSAEDVERQGRHVEAIHAVRSAAHELVSVLQQSLITGIPPSEGEHQRLSSRLEARVKGYEELEEDEGEKASYPEEERELRAFGQIRQLAADLLSYSEKLFKAVSRGQGIDRRDLEHLTTIDRNIPELVREMNEIHFSNTKFAVAESRKRMGLILGFYLAFIVIGALLILGSDIVFYKTIVLPIRRLASATIEVAGGDFRKRVSVGSKDEIGQLARSFNVMAERLEEHEQMLESLATLKERERIAREMHDGLGQVLGYLHMQLGALQERTASESQEGFQEDLAEIKRVTGEAYEEIRQSIFGLRTMVSRGLGLIPTLTEYLHDFSQQNDITVDLQIGDDRATRFSPDVEVQLVRIIQEALANIRKHAGVTRGAVRFDVDGDRRTVTINDDGRGFETGNVPDEGSRHFGLWGMRERAEGIGGQLEIDTAPGRGTKVTVRLPLEGKD
jgi:signal transduction histidine kinase